LISGGLSRSSLIHSILACENSCYDAARAAWKPSPVEHTCQRGFWITVTRLRKMMLEELERRNYSAGTTRNYLRFVERFAQHFGKSPDKLGPDHLRSCQAYLLRELKLCPGSVENHVAALRFFFVRTLHTPNSSPRRLRCWLTVIRSESRSLCASTFALLVARLGTPSEWLLGEATRRLLRAFVV